MKTVHLSLTEVFQAAKDTLITEVNTGLCARRLQEGKPAFFACWTQNNERKYIFSHQRFMIEEITKVLMSSSISNRSATC